MNFFTKLFHKKSAAPQPEQECIPPDLEAAMNDFAACTALPMLKLSIIEGESSPFASKLGGAPYLPPGYDYPCSSKAGDEGQPLHLLAQFNLDQLPHLPGWPDSGMLQFYLADDDVYGLDFSDNLSQSGWRVLYHPQIDYSLSHYHLLPSPHRLGAFPLEEEYLLAAELVEQPMSATDFRFGALFDAALRPLGLSYGALPDEQRDRVYDRFSAWGSHLGGYPAFTQEDPRTVGDVDAYSVLLLQLDSDYKQGILWGDSGVANFFITPGQLEKRDFSRVLYNWDCY